MRRNNQSKAMWLSLEALPDTGAESLSRSRLIVGTREAKLQDDMP